LEQSLLRLCLLTTLVCFLPRYKISNLMEHSLMDGKLTLTRNIMHSFQYKHVLYMDWISILYQVYTLESKRQNNIAVLHILMESSSRHTCALDFHLQSCYSGSSWLRQNNEKCNKSKIFTEPISLPRTKNK